MHIGKLLQCGFNVLHGIKHYCDTILQDESKDNINTSVRFIMEFRILFCQMGNLEDTHIHTAPIANCSRISLEKSELHPLFNNNF